MIRMTTNLPNQCEIGLLIISMQNHRGSVGTLDAHKQDYPLAAALVSSVVRAGAVNVD